MTRKKHHQMNNALTMC